jgi:hypothetical protein
MPPAAQTPKVVLVKSTSPRGGFRRAGLQFTAEWRPLQVSTKADLEKGIIDTSILAVLEKETMLAVKPASPDDVERYLEALQETAGKDPAEEIAALKKKNAELEARLMKLELGGKADAGDKGDTKKS